LFETIKEYRDFSTPEDISNWFEYIHQIFNILGFKTVAIASRLLLLFPMGSDQNPRAMACLIGPDENFKSIIPELDWQSYLFYASKYHQVDWVILTNGFKFKVLNYAKDEELIKYIQYEFDEIISKKSVDSFYVIFKLFSMININSDKTSKSSKGNGVGSKRHQLRKEFWTQLLEKSKNHTLLFSKRSPGVGNTLFSGAGKSGFSYCYKINFDEARILLYIDNGNYNFNKKTFDSFFEHKEDIENALGKSLIWDRLDDNRASVIRLEVADFGLTSDDRWGELQEKMIKTMVKFDETFRPYIKQL
ncbi:MAG: DUF4268 domain-containing protein, partial [Promethearchaeota archaeon]